MSNDEQEPDVDLVDFHKSNAMTSIARALQSEHMIEDMGSVCILHAQVAQAQAILSLVEQLDSMFADALKIFVEYQTPSDGVKQMVEVFTHMEGADIGQLFETNPLFNAAVIAWKDYEARIVEANTPHTDHCKACDTPLDVCMKKRRETEITTMNDVVHSIGCCANCEHVVLS
jgi:hypothetical protein